MFEYVIHQVYFDRKGMPHDNKNFLELTCDTLEEALLLTETLKNGDEYYHDYNKGYYIEHRIKLDYAK